MPTAPDSAASGAKYICTRPVQGIVVVGTDVVGGVVGTVMLVSVWAGAVAGVVLAAVGIAEKRFVGGTCYVALGWVAVAAAPADGSRVVCSRAGRSTS